MTTLATLRGVVQTDLKDAAQTIWTNAEIDRHVQRAVREYSFYSPLEDKDELAVTPGSRDVSISTLAPRIRVVAAEYPTAQYPPSFVPFRLWVDTLTLDLVSAPASGNVAVYWHKEHTIDGTGSTFPSTHDDIIATGAAGYAAQELVAYIANKVNVGGEDAWGRYTSLATERLKTFRDMCQKLPQASRVKTGRMFSPEPAAFRSETTDPGPV